MRTKIKGPRLFMVCHHCRKKMYVSRYDTFVHCGDCNKSYRLMAKTC